ncbi:MAG: dihydrofolate reductase family protein [Methanomassiliicoccaceae archaeon]|nr:dihydrofolate reductase family protein [Methanomassiliicoccaceae archaeon]
MRPFVHVNCAMSADGKIAGGDRKQVRISSDEDMARSKALRKQYQAILVGVGTVIADDPHLTIKGSPFNENPVRIVVDPHGRTPDNAAVADERAETIILTDDMCTAEWTNAHGIACGDPFDLVRAMNILAEEGIESLLVEGGGETIASFFELGLVDRYTVFVGGLIIGGRDSPTPVDGDGWVCGNGVKLNMKSAEVLGNGVLITYEIK